jgi:hypothetical protein
MACPRVHPDLDWLAMVRAPFDALRHKMEECRIKYERLALTDC